MIKPEDVPQYLVQHIEKCFDSGYYGSHDTDAIARFLNLCVEAGVVSPSVYTARDKDGYLLDDEVYGLWSDPDRAVNGLSDGCYAEHYRGQTK